MKIKGLMKQSLQKFINSKVLLLLKIDSDFKLFGAFLEIARNFWSWVITQNNSYAQNLKLEASNILNLRYKNKY